MRRKTSLSCCDDARILCAHAPWRNGRSGAYCGVVGKVPKRRVGGFCRGRIHATRIFSTSVMGHRYGPAENPRRAILSWAHAFEFHSPLEGESKRPSGLCEGRFGGGSFFCGMSPHQLACGLRPCLVDSPSRGESFFLFHRSRQILVLRDFFIKKYWLPSSSALDSGFRWNDDQNRNTFCNDSPSSGLSRRSRPVPTDSPLVGRSRSPRTGRPHPSQRNAFMGKVCRERNPSRVTIPMSPICTPRPSASIGFGWITITMFSRYLKSAGGAR